MMRNRPRACARSWKIGARWSPFLLLLCVPWGTWDVKEGTLFPHRTPCFSLVPVLSQCGSRCRVSEPLRESICKAEAGRGCRPREALCFFPNIVLEVAGDRAVERDRGAGCHLFGPSGSAKPLSRRG